MTIAILLLATLTQLDPRPIRIVSYDTDDYDHWVTIEATGQRTDGYSFSSPLGRYRCVWLGNQVRCGR